MHKPCTNAFSSSQRKALWGGLVALFLCIQAIIYQVSWWPLANHISGAGRDFIATHPLLSPTLFIALYTITNICCLPVNTVLRVCSGMLFGLTGIVYALTASVLGASINYSMGRHLLSPIQLNNHQVKLHRIHQTLQQHPVMSLLILRWVPLFPAWLVSMAAGYLHYRTTPFILISLVGFIPACCLYVYVGATGYQLLTLYNLPSTRSIVCCAIIFALIISYMAFRKSEK